MVHAAAAYLKLCSHFAGTIMTTMNYSTTTKAAKSKVWRMWGDCPYWLMQDAKTKRPSMVPRAEIKKTDPDRTKYDYQPAAFFATDLERCMVEFAEAVKGGK